MLIFRCEHRPLDHEVIGVGAFSGLAGKHDDAACENQDGTRAYSMPCPDAEPEGNPVHEFFVGRGRDSEMRFGFESIRSYREAFNSPTGRQRMDDNGGVLSVYEVDREYVLIGFAQVVFDHRKAKRVAVLKCTDDYYAS